MTVLTKKSYLITDSNGILLINILALFSHFHTKVILIYSGNSFINTKLTLKYTKFDQETTENIEVNIFLVYF